VLGAGLSWTDRLSIAIWPTESCGFIARDRLSFGVGPPFFVIFRYLRLRGAPRYPLATGKSFPSRIVHATGSYGVAGILGQVSALSRNLISVTKPLGL